MDNDGLWYYNTRMDDLKLGCIKVQKITNFYPISLWLGNRRVTVLLNNEFKYRKERASCKSFLVQVVESRTNPGNHISTPFNSI